MTQNKLISSQTNAPYAGMRQHILRYTFARLLRPSFLYQCCALLHEDECIQGDTHTYVSTRRALACFLCGAKMLHRHLSVGLIHGSLVFQEEPRHLHVPVRAGPGERQGAVL